MQPSMPQVCYRASAETQPRWGVIRGGVQRLGKDPRAESEQRPAPAGAHKRIRDCNGGSPTSMRPADSYWEGAVAMCWVTAWMSRRARWRGLRR